jgi:DNA-binding transcriptional LysR family regulator
LRQLEIFLEAAADCNFRYTADRLSITQPAVSSQLKQLETELGYPLFERRQGRSPILTREGASLVPSVKDLLQTSRSIVSAKKSPRGRERIDLKLCARNFLFEHDLLPYLPDFLQQNENIRLNITVFDNTDDIVRAMQREECDIALYRGCMVPSEIGRVEILAPRSISIYASADIARNLRECPRSIGELPFLLPPEGSEVAAALLRALDEDGVYPKNVIARSQFPSTLTKWLLDGRGVSPLLDHHMLEFVDQGLAEMVAPLSCSIITVMGLNRRAMREEAAPLTAFVREILGSRVSQ